MKYLSLSKQTIINLKILSEKTFRSKVSPKEYLENNIEIQRKRIEREESALIFGGRAERFGEKTFVKSSHRYNYLKVFACSIATFDTVQS